MPAKKIVVPAFKTQKEETAWWNAHRKQVESSLRQSIRGGHTLTIGDVVSRAKAKPKLMPVTLRLPEEDIATARLQASGRGLGYQTYIKMLLHDALRKALA